MIIPLYEADFLPAFWKSNQHMHKIFGGELDDRQLVSVSLNLIAMKSWDIAWSKAVKERDRYTCRAVFPGCTFRGRVEAHHIVGRQHKMLRYCFLNGIAVCPNCHSKFERQPWVAKMLLPRMLKQEHYERLRVAAKTIYNIEIG